MIKLCDDECIDSSRLSGDIGLIKKEKKGTHEGIESKCTKKLNFANIGRKKRFEGVEGEGGVDEKRMAVWIEEDLIVVAYYAVPFVSIVAILTPRLAINGIVKNLLPLSFSF